MSKKLVYCVVALCLPTTTFLRCMEQESAHILREKLTAQITGFQIHAVPFDQLDPLLQNIITITMRHPMMSEQVNCARKEQATIVLKDIAAQFHIDYPIKQKPEETSAEALARTIKEHHTTWEHEGASPVSEKRRTLYIHATEKK